MKPETRAAVERHWRKLQAIFPAARDRDPVALCRVLRRLEREAVAVAVRDCNGPPWSDPGELDREYARIAAQVDRVLNFTGAGVPVTVGDGRRGYQIKIDYRWMSEHQPHGPAILITDMGGNGVIAPDLA